MNIEAHLVGGPGNGRIMGIPDIKREIVIAHLERPISFASYLSDEDPFARVPAARFSYRPVRAVVYYEVAGMDRT